MTFIFRFSSEMRRSSSSGPNVRARERRRSVSGGSAYRNNRTWNWLSPSVDLKCPEREAATLWIQSFNETTPKTFRWSFCMSLPQSQALPEDHSGLLFAVAHQPLKNPGPMKCSTTELCFAKIIYSFTKYCRSYEWGLLCSYAHHQYRKKISAYDCGPFQFWSEVLYTLITISFIHQRKSQSDFCLNKTDEWLNPWHLPIVSALYDHIWYDKFTYKPV